MRKSLENRSIIFVQPALPSYRIDFFDRIYESFGNRLRVYYSPGQLGSLTSQVNRPWAYEVGNINRIPGNLAWQRDVIDIPLRRNDILVLSGNPRHISTLILLFKAKVTSVRTVWWGHYWSSTSRRWRQVLRFLPMAMSDAILFYVDNEVERFIDDPMTIGKNKVLAALNNGIDDTLIQLHRQPYVATERARELLFVGRLTKKANLRLALRALAKLGDKAPVLHVVGAGDQEKFLQSLAVNLGVADFVHWHGESTNEEFIARIANKCRAFIYPGEVGLSLIHSMAYGLPALVHNEARLHMPEIAAFEDGWTGASFVNGDEDSLAAIMDEYMDNYIYLDKCSKNSISIVSNSYTTKSMSVRFSELVKSLDSGS